MGQLYSFRLQQFGATGVPIPSARLYTFDPVATTTPKATYSDNDLSVSNGAYVQADAAGVFPQIFAANGEAFYASLRTAAGVEVQQFEFLTALGSDDASSLLRDFTTNGRFQVRGADGIVQIETGDPAGDDVGGDARMGGWEGTQGTTLELDYALATFTGNQIVSGSASIGTDVDLIAPTSAGAVYAKLSTGTATAATNVDIALPAGFDSYVLEIDYLTTSVSGAVNARLAFDAGPTFKSGAGDYLGPTTYITGTTPGSTANSTSINITSPSVVGAGARYGRCELRIDSKAGLETMISGMCQVFVSTSALISWICGSTDAKNYGKATYIRLLATAGTTSFRYALFGIPGLGTT